MRRNVWWAALLLILLGGATADAQDGRRPIFFGVDPTTIQNVPIDTSTANVPIASPMTRPTRFRLLDFFPRFNFSLGKPIIGQSIFPTEAELPGADYLRPFRIRRPGPVGQ